MKRILPATLLTLCTTAAIAQTTSPPSQAPPASTAQPLALLLEQAIYQEQTAGNSEAAAKTYNQIIEQAAVTRTLAAQAMARLAALQARQKQLTEAAQTLDRLKREYPEQSDLITRTTAAMPTLPDAPEQPQAKRPPPTPDEKADAANRVTEGWRHMQERRYKDAAEAFKGATEKDPTSSAAFAGSGWAALNSGEQHNGAQNYFWRALALDPKNASALNGMGWSWMKNPEFIPPGVNPREEARKSWKRALEVAPDATSPISGLAQAALDESSFDEAISWYGKWLKLEPNNADATIGLARARQGQAIVEEATLAAGKFFEKLESGDYNDTTDLFLGSAPHAQFTIGGKSAEGSSANWEDALKTYRAPMGKTLSRKITSVSNLDSRSGRGGRGGGGSGAAFGQGLSSNFGGGGVPATSPAGSFGRGRGGTPIRASDSLTLTFTTQFENRKNATEAVMLIRTDGDTWSLSAYILQTPDFPRDPLKAGG